MKHCLNSKLKIGIVAIAAVLLIAAVVATACVGIAGIRDKRSAEAICFEPYRKLYAMKKTHPKETEKVDSIINLTDYYSENAEILQYEQKTEDGKFGIVFELKKTSIYPIQSDECRQQATVLLMLIPKLDFVDYQVDGEIYRSYRQYGEDSGGKVYVVGDDSSLSDNVKTCEDFAAFMEHIRPSYESQSLYEAAGKVVLAECGKKITGGELVAEGHAIMSAENVNGKSKICIVASYGGYRFINENFVRIEGKKIIPAVFTFSVNDNGSYMFEHADFDVDGLKYEDAVKQMFVKEVADSTLQNHESLVQQLEAQETQQAQSYLTQLGRNSKIGKFADFPTEYLSSNGISSDVANTILANDQLLSYPMWIGTQEFVEDGNRFVYETSFHEGDTVIVMKKYNYDTKEIVEEFQVSAYDGNIVS